MAGIRHPLVQHLFSSSGTSSSFNCQIRASSLSAIHRGVRRSQRVQDDDPISAILASKRRGSEWERRGRLTAKALDGVSSPRQAQKLRKKLEKEQEDDGKRLRQTRRSRFLDPDKPFGKNSIVYQLKHGVLKDEVASLKIRRPAQPAPFRSTKPEKGRRLSQASALEQAIWGKSAAKSEKQAARPERNSRPWQPRDAEQSREDDAGARPRDRDSGASPRDRDFDGRPRDRDSGARPRDRDFGASPRDRDSGARPRDREFDGRREQSMRKERSERSEPFSKSDRPPRRSFDERSNSETQRYRSSDRQDVQDQDGDAYRGQRKDTPPVSIKYTTAASQFLYGKSVVKAALEQHRRKLYNLYIYAGDTRKDSKDDAAISSAAERRGVSVTMVPNGEQSMMDRMSMGRPHNGFVLEASPLQQPPITSLGHLEESLGKLGFHVELGYQSKEEEAVNGLETFVARKNDITAKPFVLFLNEILDPGNLGGLLRTASYLGVDAVVMTNRSSSTLTPVVLKSAAGAAEEVSIFTVDSPVEFIERSRKAGWKVYAAVAPPDSKLAKMHEDKFISTDAVERRDPLSRDPCVLVLGNEGHGLSKPVKMAADYELSIPRFVQDSSVDSLNVSVAAGLLCHAFVKAPGVKRDAVAGRRQAFVKRSDRAKGDEAKSEDTLF